MDPEAADRLVARLGQAPTLFLLHVNADPDCVASAFALQQAFGGDVGAPDGLARAGEALARHVGLVVDPWPHPERYANVVAVDTSSRSQLGRLGPRVPAPMLVDHHAYGDLLEHAPAHAWDPTRPSCAEVVLALLARAGRAPGAAAAEALLCGIVADTARFLHADARTLRTAAALVEEHGASLAVAHEILGRDPSLPDEDALDSRNAALRAAQRAEVETVGPFLLVASHVRSFDAAAAAALVRAGADLAVVAAERQDRARLSLRASRRLLGTRDLHLGELANAVAREVGWSGGGHAGAAGLSGPPPADAARAALLARVRARLEGS